MESDRPNIVEVLLDQGAPHPLDYQSTQDLPPGTRVHVPLRKSITSGTVIRAKSTGHPRAKPIHTLESPPKITQEQFLLAQFLSTYYATPLHRCLKLFMPQAAVENTQEAQETLYVAAIPKHTLKNTLEDLPAHATLQKKLLTALLENPFLTSQEIAPYRSALKKYETQGIILRKTREQLQNFQRVPTQPKTLTPPQQQAADTLKQALASHTFSPYLLHGVTGSGKTEVYCEVIQEALKQNASTLFLIPEIALGNELAQRLSQRFPNKTAFIHHKLPSGKKVALWSQIQKGEIPILIGPRSALFAPIPNLRLLIVDEEHENAYKQNESMPCYHARDLAVYRAHLNKALIILGSATPSLESLHNAHEGKYQKISLLQRPHHTQLPPVHIVSMQAERETNPLLSNLLIEKIQDRLDKGEQSILFLNRRGTHASLYCPSCQTAQECPHCQYNLTFHKHENLLKCHLCGFATPTPKLCPQCKTPHMVYKGMGTQLLESTLHALIPNLRTLRMDADTTRFQGGHQHILDQFRTGKADVLIGTQMCIKGLNFPLVTLVGVINADHYLHLPDFRSQELTMQQIIQVAGRAGRAQFPGEVVLQTRLKEQPCLHYGQQHNYTQFAQQELEERKLFEYPPYTKFTRILLRAKHPEDIQEVGEKILTHLQQTLPRSTHIYPLLPCACSKIQDLTRYHILIKSTHPLQSKLLHLPQSPNVQMKIDVDPIDTFF